MKPKPISSGRLSHKSIENLYAEMQSGPSGLSAGALTLFQFALILIKMPLHPPSYD